MDPLGNVVIKFVGCTVNVPITNGKDRAVEIQKKIDDPDVQLILQAVWDSAFRGK